MALFFALLCCNGMITESRKEVLSKLNPQQREAVRHVSSPLLVLAGAGSGKTGVITSKIAWLIRERGCSRVRLLRSPFTNKAAREMRSRVKGLLSGVSSRGLTISTFHTLGLNILRKELRSAGLQAGFFHYRSERCAGHTERTDAFRADLRQQVSRACAWQNIELEKRLYFASPGN